MRSRTFSHAHWIALLVYCASIVAANWLIRHAGAVVLPAGDFGVNTPLQRRSGSSSSPRP